MYRKKLFRLLSAALIFAMTAQPAAAYVGTGSSTDSKFPGVTTTLNDDNKVQYQYDGDIGAKAEVGDGTLIVEQTGVAGLYSSTTGGKTLYLRVASPLGEETTDVPATSTQTVTFAVYTSAGGALIGTATATATNTYNTYYSSSSVLTRGSYANQTTYSDITITGTDGTEIKLQNIPGQTTKPTVGSTSLNLDVSTSTTPNTGSYLESGKNYYAVVQRERTDNLAAMTVDTSTAKTYGDAGNPEIIINSMDKSHAYGIQVTGSGTYTEEADALTSLATIGKDSAAYYFGDDFSGTANLANAAVTTSGDNSSGVEVVGDGDVSKEGGSISTIGAGSHGVNMANNTYGGGAFTFKGDMDISTDGAEAYGVYTDFTQTKAKGGVIKADANSTQTIVTNGSRSYGVYAVGHNSVGEKYDITLGKSVDITYTANGGAGNRLTGGGLKADGAAVLVQGDLTTAQTQGSNSTGVYGTNGASIDVRGNMTAETVVWNSNAVKLDGGSSLSVGDTLTVSADSSNQVFGVDMDSANLTAGTLVVSVTNVDGVHPSYGMDVADGSTVSVVGDASISIQLADGSDPTYQVYGLNVTTASSFDVGGNFNVTTSGDKAEGVGVDNSVFIVSGDATLATGGEAATAFKINNGSTATIGGNLMAATSGDDANAVDVNNSTLSVAGNATIVTSGDTATGVWVEGGGYAHIGGSLDVTTYGNADPSGYPASYGVFVSNSTVSVDKSATITTSGDRALGIYAERSASVNIGEDLDVTTSGDNADGVSAWKNALVTVGGNATIVTDGVSADGVVAHEDSVVTIGGSLDVTTNGEDAKGLQVYNSSQASVGGNLNVTTSGDTAYGAYVHDAASLDVAGNATITTSGDSATGLYVDNGGAATIGGSLDVTTSGKNYAYGVHVDNASTLSVSEDVAVKTTGSGYSDGMLIDNGSSADIGGSLSVDVTDSKGVTVQSGSELTVGGDADLASSSQYGPTLTLSNNASVDIAGDLTATTTARFATGVLLQASGDSVQTLNVGGTATITTSGDNSRGIEATNESGVQNYINIGEDLIVETGGKSSSGVLVLGTEMNVGGNAEIATSGNGSYGLFAATSSDITIDGTLDVTTSGDDAIGANIALGSTLTVGDVATIATAGAGAVGVNVIDSSSADFGKDLNVTTASNDASAVVADNNSTVNVGGNATLATSGDRSAGIEAVESSTVNVGGNAEIATSGNDSYGLLAASYSDITIDGTLDVTTEGSPSRGASIENASSLTVGGKAAIATASDDAFGVAVVDNSNASFGDTLDITTSGDFSFGAFVNDNSTLSVAGDATIETGNKSDGVRVDKNSSATFAGNVDVATSGDEAHGLYAVGSSVITIEGDTTAAVKGANSAALYASGNDYGTGTIDAKGNVAVDLTGAVNGGSDDKTIGVLVEQGGAVSVGETLSVSNTDEAQGNLAGVAALGDGTVSVAGASTISLKTATEKEASGILAGDGAAAGTANMTFGDNLDITVSGAQSASGIANKAANSGETLNVDVAGDLTITAESTVGAAGVSATDDETGSGAAIATNVKANKVTVSATGDEASAVAAIGSNSTVTLESAGARGTLTATGTTYAAGVQADDGGVATVTNFDISASGGSDVTAAAAGDGGTVNAVNSTLNGDVVNVNDTAGGGAFSVNLKELSQLNGAASALDSTTAFATNITIEGASSGVKNTEQNSSVWNVAGDSDLGTGTLSNSGVLKFAANDFTKIETGKASGTNGLYTTRVYLNNDEADANGRQGDQIVASELGSDGTGAVTVDDLSASTAWYQARMTQPLFVIKNNGAVGSGESTNFTLANSSGALEMGSWAYTLVPGLYTDPTTGETYTEWYLATFDLSAMAHAILASAANPETWYLETNALYSHINDFNEDRENIGVWGHAVYNKLKNERMYSYNGSSYVGFSYENEVEQEFYGLAGGIDKRFYTPRGQWFNGLMMGYGEGDLDFRLGNSDFNSFHVGLYSVYRAESDWYLAGLVKYNRYDTEMTINPRGLSSFKGDFDQDGWGASVMGGKRFRLKNDWFVEPQVEFGYHRVEGANYTLSNGTNVGIGDLDSVRLRGGVAFGRTLTLENGGLLDLYAKASVVHEFDGEADVFILCEPFKTDYSGTWGQYKVGLNYDAGKNYFVNFAVSYEDGGHRESPFGVELGINWLIGPKSTAAEEAAETDETEAEATENAAEEVTEEAAEEVTENAEETAEEVTEEAAEAAEETAEEAAQ